VLGQSEEFIPKQDFQASIDMVQLFNRGMQWRSVMEAKLGPGPPLFRAHLACPLALRQSGRCCAHWAPPQGTLEKMNGWLGQCLHVLRRGMWARWAVSTLVS